MKCPECKHRMQTVFQGNDDPSTWKKRTRRAARRPAQEIISVVNKTSGSATVAGVRTTRVQGPKVVRWQRVKAPSRYRVSYACRQCGGNYEFVGKSKATARLVA